MWIEPNRRVGARCGEIPTRPMTRFFEDIDPDAVGVRESSFTGERTEVHVFRDWCWLATVRDEGELATILDAPPRCDFDLDIYRLLVRRLPRAKLIPLRTSRGGVTEANAIRDTRATSLDDRYG